MKKIPSLLGLAARAGLLLAAFTSAQAALIPIDLTNFGGQNITGINAGLPNGGDLFILNQNLGSAAGGIDLGIFANSHSWFGFSLKYSDPNRQVAVAVNSSNDSDPTVFASGGSIGSSSLWSFSSWNYAFTTPSGPVAPDMGPGSYLGFRLTTPSNDYLYGYIEATWNSSSQTFQLLSAAFEDTPNQPIIAGSASASVPEPGGAAMMGVGVLAVALGVFRHFRKTATARAKGVLPGGVVNMQSLPVALAADRPQKHSLNAPINHQSNPHIRMKKIPSLLGLAARAGLLLAAFTSAQAALIPIDLTNFGGQNITGLNAGLPNGGRVELNQNLGPTAGVLRLTIANRSFPDMSFVILGSQSRNGVVATNSTYFADPKVFTLGASIGNSIVWPQNSSPSQYFNYTIAAPDILTGSYLGFRIPTENNDDYLYGYIEATSNGGQMT